MRRKIMTAFVCAIMTISVIPVYADDTQTDQAVTTEVSTETAATVQETKRTQSKEQLKKKTTSKKHTKTKKTKSKKKEENSFGGIILMPILIIRTTIVKNFTKSMKPMKPYLMKSEEKSITKPR